MDLPLPPNLAALRTQGQAMLEAADAARQIRDQQERTLRQTKLLHAVTVDLPGLHPFILRESLQLPDGPLCDSHVVVIMVPGHYSLYVRYGWSINKGGEWLRIPHQGAYHLRQGVRPWWMVVSPTLPQLPVVEDLGVALALAQWPRLKTEVQEAVS